MPNVLEIWSCPKLLLLENVPGFNTQSVYFYFWFTGYYTKNTIMFYWSNNSVVAVLPITFLASVAQLFMAHGLGRWVWVD